MSATVRSSLDDIKDLCFRIINGCPNLRFLCDMNLSYKKYAVAFDILFPVMKSFLPEIVRDNKDDEGAKTLREQGNEKFRKSHFKEAHEFYTKSIAKAVPGSEQMALAYSNRSAVLFEKKYYEECIKDIDRAFQNKCPDKIHSRLYIRKEKAEKLMKGAKKLPIFEEIPKISPENKNPVIKNAKEGINTIKNSKYGRHIVASREINIGEILAIGPPLMSVLMIEKYIYCHYCLNICYCLIPCDKCSQELYCSNRCKQKASDKYHSIECKILATLNDLGFNEVARLALRLLIINSLDIKENTLYFLNKRTEVFKLQSCLDTRSKPFIIGRIMESIVIMNLLLEHTKFLNAIDIFFSLDYFRECLLQLMEIVSVNKLMARRITANEEGMLADKTTIGYYMTTLYGFLNHSCYPNILLVEHGNVKVMRTITTIKPGEPLTINYLNNEYANSEKKTRQRKLKEVFCFDCDCIACLNDWPVWINQQTSIHDSLQKDLISVRKGHEKEAHSVLAKWMPKMETMPPSIEAQAIHDLISFCFSVLGNKQFLF